METPYYWLDDDPPYYQIHMLDLRPWYILDVTPKIGWKIPPKRDGENNDSKPYEQMDDLGVPWGSIILGNTHIYHYSI